MTITGPRKKRTKRSAVLVSGAAVSVLPVTVTRKSQSVAVVGGAWSLRVRLKPGKNRIVVTATDVMGQTVTATRVLRRDRK